MTISPLSFEAWRLPPLALALALALAGTGCIELAGVEDVEPLPDAGQLDEGHEPQEREYLKAQVPTEQDRFGHAVAIDGDVVVVTALHDDSGATGVGGDPTDDSVKNSGAAYVIDLSGDTPITYLKADHSDESLYFGRAVAASGDTVLVAAGGDDSGVGGIDSDPTDETSADSGAVHVFVRTGKVWSQQAYLKASDPVAGDGFGGAVAIDGDTAVVGVPYRDEGGTNLGAAYVFVRDGESWSQQAVLTAPAANGGSGLGGSVAISGDVIAVGTHSREEAHLFERTGQIWSHRETIASPSGQDLATFGAAVALGDGVVAVGAPNHDTTAGSAVIQDAGQVYLFDLDGRQLATLNPVPTKAEHFGRSLAIDGDRLVVGRSSVKSQQIAAFKQQDGDWRYVAEIRSEFTDRDDQFGSSIALAANRLIASAPAESSGATHRPTDNSAPRAGAAYVFDL